MKQPLNSAVIHVVFATGDQTYQTLPRTEPAHDPLMLAAWLEDVAGQIRQTARRLLRADTNGGVRCADLPRRKPRGCQ